MRRHRHRQSGILAAALLLGLAATRTYSAQQKPAETAAPETESAGHKPSPPKDLSKAHTDSAGPEGLKMGVVGRFIEDQRSIWTSPANLRLSDAEWIAPLSGITGGLFATDYEYTRRLSTKPSTIQHYKTLSNGGVGALVGAGAGMWLLGHVRHNEHWSETGFLAGESALNSLVVVEGMKYSLRRERPFQGTGDGPFFHAGGTSFPSEHAAAAWSVASVIAHEYPGPLTKLVVYGLAATVDIARVRGRQHFPSDVVVGSVIGNLVAQNIYSRHHDAELGGAQWQSLHAYFADTTDMAPHAMGSTSVPLDSWVYPAFERLAALGYLDSAFQGVKPWTRTECARLLGEARDALDETSNDEAASRQEEAQKLLDALTREFHREVALETGDRNDSAQLDSVYTRVMSVSGAALTDGYHFGQTYGYDFGRPFRRGTNWIAGSSATFTTGRLFLYLNGEYEHAPSAPALSDPVRQTIADRDRAALSAARPFDAVDHFTLLDSYVGLNLDNWQVSFGKQSLSWGPGRGGSLILSNNAEPFYMLRISQVEPLVLPGFLSVLGPVRLESFMGREKGHPLSGRPFLYGQKVSLKPFRSFEFAYARTTTLGGFDDPFTGRTFLLSFFGRLNAPGGSVPGDSHTSMDWTWRIPGLHDRLVFYGELEDDDDPIPFQNLTKAVLRPGFYLPSLPFLPKWDFHAEWTSSESPGRKFYQGQGALNYWNQSYRDGYTNNGNLAGNIVGREGKGIQAWTRYWISPQNTLDLSFKLSEVDNDFIPGGGKWQDYRVDYETHFHSGTYLKSLVQFERIGHYPLLFSGSRNNVTAALEIGFQRSRVH